jgi:Tripartite tricarboxylate transporter family receptor
MERPANGAYRLDKTVRFRRLALSSKSSFRGSFSRPFFAGHVAAKEPDTADWPTKPVQLIVNFPAGSTTDYAARIFADRLASGLGQQFVTRNRAGACGLLGIGTAVKSSADGYTFLVTAGFSVVIAPHLLRTTSFDPFKDLEPVTQFIDAALLLAVHPSVEANSVQELVTFARRNPGKLSWGTADIGSTTHLLCEAFRLQAGVDILHVPYRSGSQGLSGSPQNERRDEQDCPQAGGARASAWKRIGPPPRDPRGVISPDAKGLRALQQTGTSAEPAHRINPGIHSGCGRCALARRKR